MNSTGNAKAPAPSTASGAEAAGRGDDVHFTFLRADTPELMAQCRRLRYEVYCVERGFLDPADYAQGEESDYFDPYAVHFAAVARNSGQVVGTIRLVARTPQGFPLSSHCDVDLDALPPKTMEISRLAVSRTYRRRQDDGEYGISLNYIQSPDDPQERRRRPEIVLGLYKCMYRESKALQVDAWLAAMEPSLARLLGRFSFSFVAIGPEVDYYGPVTPYLARIDQMEKIVRHTRPMLYAEFTGDGPV